MTCWMHGYCLLGVNLYSPHTVLRRAKYQYSILMSCPHACQFFFRFQRPHVGLKCARKKNPFLCLFQFLFCFLPGRLKQSLLDPNRPMPSHSQSVSLPWLATVCHNVTSLVRILNCGPHSHCILNIPYFCKTQDFPEV